MSNRRFTATALLATALLALGPATTAHAHGDTIRLAPLQVTAGHPSTVAVWDNDGDPVDEKIAGTLSATSADGTTVGPWRLVPVPGAKPGSLTTKEALPAGRWTITAETAFPALGRVQGQAEVTTASLSSPTPAPARTEQPSAGQDTGSGSGSTTTVVALTAAAVVAAGLAGFWLLRRRARRS
ncbi:hypothetical protein [Streptomyces orinoci]|uniref:Uncharacterized protein n=1 Tax=Streptomyces orinoci TaxID=67339 RepID=A0ABV3K5D3_STRON|nr:hypothetical protein [Streptomyces orinoci]